MADLAYMNGRRKYQRPQAVLLANNPGTIITQGGQKFYVPLGNEIGSDTYQSNLESGTFDDLNEFIILSDDNRRELDFTSERIEKRERMINGRMRSYHIADKVSLSVAWDMLPSRAFSKPPAFVSATGKPASSIVTQGYNSGMQKAPLDANKEYTSKPPILEKEYTPKEYDTTYVQYFPQETVWVAAGDQVPVTAAYGDGSTTYYFSENNFKSGQIVSIANMLAIGESLDAEYVTIAIAKPDYFTVSSKAVGSSTTLIGYAQLQEKVVIPRGEILKSGDKVTSADKIIELPPIKNVVAGTGVTRLVEPTTIGIDPDGAPTTHFSEQYTSDGGAGGVEILDWYKRNTGSFWVYLAYDNYSNFSKTDAGYTNLQKYNEVIEVFFSDFSHSVVKRGGSNYDFWNISFSLEEA